MIITRVLFLCQFCDDWVNFGDGKMKIRPKTGESSPELADQHRCGGADADSGAENGAVIAMSHRRRGTPAPPMRTVITAQIYRAPP